VATFRRAHSMSPVGGTAPDRTKRDRSGTPGRWKDRQMLVIHSTHNLDAIRGRSGRRRSCRLEAAREIANNGRRFSTGPDQIA
jgi:hypothetical protein